MLRVNNKCFNKCKGLVLYIDNMDDIPPTLFARSQIGLCTYTERELSVFIAKGTSKYITNCIPINKNNNIVGYVNAHKWAKLVTL